MLFLTVARRLWATSFLFGVVVNAQSNVEILVFGTNALPSCANGCQMLLNAQSGCVPPAAPVTSPQIYKSCFCQSALLITLRTTPVGVCDTVCTDPTALTQIMTWYNSYCASGDLPSVSSSVSTPSATTSSTTSTSMSAVASKSSGNQPTQSWMDGHWKYVVVIIVLAVMIIGGAIGAVLFKRHKRRATASQHSPQQMVAWGPHQVQHHTRGFGYLEPSHLDGPSSRSTPTTLEKPRPKKGAKISLAPSSSESGDSRLRWSEAGKKERS